MSQSAPKLPSVASAILLSALLLATAAPRSAAVALPGPVRDVEAAIHYMPTIDQVRDRADWDDAPQAARDAGLAPAVASGNMFYHGGPIQKTPTVYLVFWGWQGVDPSGIAPYAVDFFGGLGGSSWANIQTQYDESTAPHTRGYITNPSSQLGGVWYDDDPVATAESFSPDLFIATEALRAATHFGYDQDATYMVFTATQRNTVQFGLPVVGFCAWHSAVRDTSNRWVAYANIPYLTDAPLTCPSNLVNSGAAGKLDAVSVVAGHEYGEAVTDPVPVTGWTDSSGGSGENGDKCAWLTSGPGRMQNIVLSTGSFAVQGLWSNAVSGCDIGYSPAVTADAGGPYAGSTSTAIAITGGATGGSTPYTCAWSGTGATFGSASSCSTTVTYSTAGTKTLSLTVTDSASATSTDSATVTVTAAGTITAATGGPYSGTAASAVAIHGSGSGGTAPYSCAWSGTGLSFASASSCATTLTATTPGTYTLSLTVTDSSSATGSDSTTVTIGASAPTCVVDSPADALLLTADPTGLSEITGVCAQDLLTPSLLEVTIDTAGMATENLLATTGSPIVYTVYVDTAAASFSAQHSPVFGWQLRNNAAGTASAGSLTSSSTTLTVDIPFGEVSSVAGYRPSAFSVSTRVGALGTTVANLDTAPNAGFRLI